MGPRPHDHRRNRRLVVHVVAPVPAVERTRASVLVLHDPAPRGIRRRGDDARLRCAAAPLGRTPSALHHPRSDLGHGGGHGARFRRRRASVEPGPRWAAHPEGQEGPPRRATGERFPRRKPGDRLEWLQLQGLRRSGRLARVPGVDERSDPRRQDERLRHGDVGVRGLEAQLVRHDALADALPVLDEGLHRLR